MISIKTQKELKSNPYIIIRFIYQQLLTLSLNIVQFLKVAFGFPAHLFFLPCEASSAILHNRLLNFSDVSVSFTTIFVKDMDLHTFYIDRHASLVTMPSSTEAFMITGLQLGHFTAVSNDFISTEQIVADFIFFSFIASSTSSASRNASSSNTMVELEVVLKYRSFL